MLKLPREPMIFLHPCNMRMWRHRSIFSVWWSRLKKGCLCTGNRLRSWKTILLHCHKGKHWLRKVMCVHCKIMKCHHHYHFLYCIVSTVEPPSKSSIGTWLKKCLGGYKQLLILLVYLSGTTMKCLLMIGVCLQSTFRQLYFIKRAHTSIYLKSIRKSHTLSPDVTNWT